VRRWLPALVLGMAQFVMVSDSTVMNVSISAVVADLGTTVPSLQLAIASYTLVMAAFMLVGAALGSRWGRRRTLVIGLVIYATGSAVTAVAPTFAVLYVGWSVLEGVGAVLVVPALSALMAVNYTGRDRAVAFGLLGGIAGAAAAAGPLIGGWATSTLSWRVVFAAEVVLVLVILGLVRKVGDRPVTLVRERFDLVGAALSAVGLFLVVVAVVRSGTWGWFQVRPGQPELLGMPPTLPLVIAGVSVLLALHSWQERLVDQGRTPLLDSRLLVVPSLHAGLGTVAVQQLLLAGTFFVLPLYLQMVLGFDALQAGIRILPLSLSVLVVALVGSRLASVVAPRRLIRVGLTTAAVGVLTAGVTMGPELREPSFALAMAVVGAGVGLVASQVTNVVQSSVDADRSSEAGGLLGTAQTWARPSAPHSSGRCCCSGSPPGSRSGWPRRGSTRRPRPWSPSASPAGWTS
jgi:MFS family permease